MTKTWKFGEEDEETTEQEKEKAEDPLGLRFLKTRTVVISGPIDKKVADQTIKQLLLLDSESQEPIKVYINSPGGDADAGFAIFDMIRFIRSRVKTIAIGLTASAGTIILLASQQGDRYCLPHARLLIHQPSAGFQGDITDLNIHAKEILRLKERGNILIARETRQPLEKVIADTERDHWLYAEEAKEYGLIDKIVTKITELEE